jgi:hypothetical protein
MKFKLNPITGDLDRVTGNWNYIQKLNPITGKFNLVDSADSYKQIINPLTGNFQLWALSWGWWDIPEQYAVLDYIESTGTQYIVLPYKVNDKTDFSIRYARTGRNPTMSVADIIFWSVSATPTTNNASNWILRLVAGRNTSWGMNRVWVWNWLGTVAELVVWEYDTENTWYNIHIKNNYYTINDIDVFTNRLTPTEGTWRATADLWIWARVGLEWAVTMPSVIKLASVVIKENWVELYNLVPVVRADWIVWMFNTVDQTFYANSWTWNYVPWPFAIPEWYTKDEYFSCPALPYVWYVWINTWILPKYSMSISIDYSVYSTSSIYVFWAREWWWTQQMTFSWSQSWGTITSYVWGNYVAAQTEGTRWARVANQENRYQVNTIIYWEPWTASTTFDDLINERTDTQNFTFDTTLFDANTVPMYIWWNWREPEPSTTRIHRVSIEREENWQPHMRLYLPISHWDNHWFYELFTKQFLHY